MQNKISVEPLDFRKGSTYHKKRIVKLAMFPDD